MAPTKRTSLTWKEKFVILDKLKLLKQGTSQRSATLHHRIWLFSHDSWHLEDELGPTGLIIQPLISATLVRSEGGWYNRILLYYSRHDSYWTASVESCWMWIQMKVAPFASTCWPSSWAWPVPACDTRPSAKTCCASCCPNSCASIRSREYREKLFAFHVL